MLNECYMELKEALRRVEYGLSVTLGYNSESGLGLITIRVADDKLFSISKCSSDTPLGAALQRAIGHFDLAKNLRAKMLDASIPPQSP